MSLLTLLFTTLALTAITQMNGAASTSSPIRQALNTAMQCKNFGAIQDLFIGSSQHLQPADGTYALCCAALHSDNDLALFLLEQQVPLELPAPGLGPLHLAAQQKNEKLVQVLLEKKANVQAVDAHGASPLHHALSAGVVNLLLAAKAHVDSRDMQLGTPLHYRAQAKHSKDHPCITALLSGGANKKAQNYAGYTPYQVHRNRDDEIGFNARAEGHQAIRSLLNYVP